MGDPERDLPCTAEIEYGMHFLSTFFHKPYLLLRLFNPAFAIFTANPAKSFNPGFNIMKITYRLKQACSIHIGSQFKEESESLATFVCQIRTRHKVIAPASPDVIIHPPVVPILVLMIKNAVNRRDQVQALKRDLMFPIIDFPRNMFCDLQDVFCKCRNISKNMMIDLLKHVFPCFFRISFNMKGIVDMPRAYPFESGGGAVNKEFRGDKEYIFQAGSCFTGKYQDIFSEQAFAACIRCKIINDYLHN